MKIAVLLLIAGAAFARAQPGAVTFPAPDGHTLHAEQFGRGPRGVVLVHGGRFTKEGWRKQGEILAQHGFRVLAVDFREQYPDVLTAVRYLRAHGVKSVAVVGASMGGDAAGNASVESRPGEIDRLVFLASAGGDFPGRLKGKKLFILSRDDANTAGPRLPRISAAYTAAPGPKQMVILEGSAHAQFLFDTDQGPRLMQEILRFLQSKP